LTSTLLKATREGAVLLEVLSELLERGRADAAERPEASAGFSRFDASMLPPEVAPAPTIVWISSTKRMAPSLLWRDFTTPFRRSSNSPR
jgi:hypothetical protein